MQKNLLKSLACMMAFVAMPLAAQEVTLTALTADDDATIAGMSNNGKWAVGYAFDNSDNAASNINASVWNLETGERTVLTSYEDGISEANCISNDGTLIGGAYLGEAAYYTNGAWHALPKMEGYTMGTVKSLAITPEGDTIFVGYIMDGPDGQAAEAVKWVNGAIEYVNPDNFIYDRFGELATVNTCWDISEDGNVILGSMEFNAKPHQSAFIANGDDIYLIETETENNYNFSFIFAPKMSANGKYVVGSYRHVIFEDGNQFPTTDIYQPCLFDTEAKRLQVFECPFECGAYDVDNNGHIYVNSPVETNPIRQAYIYKEGEYVELERILRPAGITQAQTEEVAGNYNEEGNDNLGTILAVSADGLTIVGCAGECKRYNWVARLSKSLYEMDVEVSNTPISYDNLAAYYNNGTIILSGMVDRVEVYNVTGALVMNQAVESAFVDAQLKTGIYIVKMYNNTSNTISTSKIIVK